MTFEEDLSNSLKHVRFVHFSLLVICVAVLYFVSISWSSAPELAAELRRFKAYVEQVKSNPEAIFDLNSKWYLLQIELLKREFSEWIDPDVISKNHVERWIRNSTVQDYEKPKMDTNRDSLEKLQNRIDQLDWSVLTIGDISDVPGLKEWFQVQKKRSEQFDNFWIWLDPNFRAIENPTDAAGSVTVEVRISALFSSDGDGPYGNAFGNFSLTYIPYTAQVRMADAWFEDDYPILLSYWDQLRQRTIKAALTWVAEERTRLLKDEKVSLLGTEFRAVYIGFIGPFVIIFVLLYVMVHVNHIERRLATRSVNEKVRLHFVPWVGGMNGIVPKTVTGASFLVVSPLSVALPVWRLNGELSVAFVLFAISLCLGWLSFRSSRAISCDQK